MFDSIDKQKIDNKFKDAIKINSELEKELNIILENCNEEEKFCLKYLYAYMPIPDITDYKPSLFLKFVKHSLKARAIMPWGKDISDIDFLNYVLQYRINNENVEYYSEIFFDELYPKIKDLSMYNAIIEVNYWAFSKATYKATDDRTASALTVIKNAYGRCGEESTFLVSALRSVCLPARQCYTPRWAHCDDNHAWVEVLCDRKWHFLGACEPEIRLDTGWFKLPASKAMLVHNRVFCDIVGDEIITRQTDSLTEINILDNYAKTKKLSLKILDENKKPIENLNVHFEVVNYCEFYPIFSLLTDKNGKVEFVTGYGDLMLFMYNDKGYNYKKIEAFSEGEIEIIFKPIQYESESFEIELRAPKGSIDEEDSLTKEKEQEKKKKNDKSLKIREEFVKTFYDEDKAKTYSKKFNSMQEEIAYIMPLTRGNYKEIEKFLEEENTKDSLRYKVLLLKALRIKDLTDITYEILMENLEESLIYKKDFQEEIFIENILNPRVWNENISLYKKSIKNTLNEDEKNDIIKSPIKVIDFVERKVNLYTTSEYTNLTTSPFGALKFGLANSLSIDILKVAILRTLGVPSKLDKSDASLMFFKDGKWNKVSNNKKEDTLKATLVLNNKDNLEYFKNFTIGRLLDNCYKTLDFEDIKGDKLSYTLEEGIYRIVLASRNLEEANIIKVEFVNIEEGKTKTIDIKAPSVDKINKKLEIEDRELSDKEGNKQNLLDIINNKKAIVSWLKVGEEPTEHLLNEIMEAKDKYNDKDLSVIFIVQDEKDLKNPTLVKTLAEVENICVYIEKNGYNIDAIYSGLSILNKKLPLAIALDEDKKAINGFSGYNVGIGQMLIKTLND